MTLAELIETMPGEATKTDQQVMDWLNELTGRVDIPLTDFVNWLSANGGRDRVRIATDHVNEDVRNAALLMVDLISIGQDLLLSSTVTRTNLAPLVGSGKPFSVAQKNELLAMSNAKIERWKEAGIPRVWGIDIAKARAS